MIGDDSQLKRRFASLLFSGKDASRCAKEIFPDDSIKALFVSKQWPSDSIVTAELARLESDTSFIETSLEANDLPTKEYVKRLITSELIGILSGAEKDSDRINAAKELKLLFKIDEDVNSKEGLYNSGAIILPATMNPEDWQEMVYDDE